MDNEDQKVSSELYTEYNYSTNLKPNVSQNNVVSKFPFTYPPRPPQHDSDGDLIVQRKRNDGEGDAIEIEHSSSTVLGLVGLQVWRGALLLADWLLHNGDSFSKHKTILELGSGTGLASIVAAMYAPVICTDVDQGEILQLIKQNVVRNKAMVRHPVTVAEIDFARPSLNEGILNALPSIEIILAADVIYDDHLTDAFVKTIELILAANPNVAVYVALERRYVFTLADCDTVAPCYEYFLERMNRMKSVKSEELPLSLPQYFKYDRVKELVLWKISKIN